MNSLSVEQVYLITKLRSSGVSKNQVIDAWAVMDEVDKDYQSRRQTDVAVREPHTMPNIVPPKEIASKLSTLSNRISITPITLPCSQQQQQQAGLTDNSQSSNDSESEFCQQLSPSLVLDTMDTRDPEAVFLEYKAKPELEVVDEIKTFVMIHNIKQQRIADMSGISQGYISKFFRGEGSEMSDRSKNQIIRWYLKYRDYPEKIFEFVTPREKDNGSITPRAITYGSPSTSFVRAPSTAITTINPSTPSTNSLLAGTRMLASNMAVQSRFTLPSVGLPANYLGSPLRRHRFIFRKQQIEILEKYFKQNEYPDQYTKQQIVDELNKISEDGRPLSERDRVSYSVVSTWFNNKRKERSRTNPQLSPSRGKGRPPRSEYYQSGDDSRSQDEISNKRPRSVSPSESDAIVSDIDFENLVYDGRGHVKLESRHNGVSFEDNHGLVDDVAVFDYDENDFDRFMNPKPDLAFKDCSKTYSRNTQPPTNPDEITSDVNHPD